MDGKVKGQRREAMGKRREEDDPQIIYVILIFSIVLFFTGKACGMNEFADRIDTLQNRVVDVENRLSAIEYPKGKKKYFWPQDTTIRSGEMGKRRQQK